MTTKTVYLFDPATGEFRGTYKAQESPLEPGEFIVPFHSTPLPPPVCGADECAVFMGGAWVVSPDFRGRIFYDQTTGTAVEITHPGAVPANLGPSLPAAIVAVNHAAEKAAVLNQVRAIRETVLNRLTGIQVNTPGADTATLAAIATARTSLLNITTDAGVIAAVDGASTRIAAMAVWQATSDALAIDAPLTANVFSGISV